METSLKKQPARQNTKKQPQQPFGKRLTIDEFRQEAFADLNSGDIPFEEFKREMDKKWKSSRKN